jgi:excisionase family DNA binding protein
MRPDSASGSSPSSTFQSLWTANDVAAYLKVSRSWVYHRAESGELPYLRIGALLRFDPERIRAYARGELPAGVTVVALRGR